MPDHVILERARALVEDFAEEHGVTIEVLDSAPDQTLRVDADLLQSVLTNLLRNAVEAVAGVW